jgi:hypothetical protein
VPAKVRNLAGQIGPIPEVFYDFSQSDVHYPEKALERDYIYIYFFRKIYNQNPRDIEPVCSASI